MSATTCLVGMAKTGQALRCWSTTHPDPRVDALLGVIREQFLERELFRASNGSVLPLGVATPNAERWLDFTYPLDWRPDLIEVIDLVASGSFDRQLQPALDRLVTSQLPDGGWPLQRVIRPDALPSLERRNQRRASPYVTLRVVCALDKLGVSVRGGRQPKPSRSA